MKLSPAWVRLPVNAGCETTHWSAIGPGDAPDEAVLQWTADHDHIVPTNDLDFGAILDGSARHRPSVVQIRSDLFMPAAVGSSVLAALRKVEPAPRRGALLSVDPARARLRIRPLPGPGLA